MDEIGGDPGATFPANGLMGLFDLLDRYLTRIGHRVGVVHTLQKQGLLCGSSLLLGGMEIFLLLCLPPVVAWTLRRCGRVEANFRGDRIPQSFGVVTLLCSCTLLGATAFIYPEQRERSLVWLVCCVGFGLLGLADDTLGTRDIKGLRGHIRSALRDHRLTTGFVKAVGGVGLGLWLALQLQPSGVGWVLLRACVIALSANAINLLDLRPGRAGALFLIGALPAVLYGLYRGDAGVPPLLLVALPALRVWAADASGKVMMGDTGSNLLGGALGLAVVSYGGIVGQVASALVLIALHVLAERTSLTAIIERNSVLRALDRMTGIR